MYNLFDSKNAAAVLSRLEKITPRHTAQWGKMNTAQMLAHCAIVLDTPFKGDMKQHFLGKIFGKMARKSSLAPQPFKKNSPTDKSFIINGDRNFEEEKQILIKKINRFTEAGPEGITSKMHPFFGEFTSEDWAFLMHKHLDHHFGQFGA